MAKAIADLRRELEAKEAQLKELRARRRRIAGQLEVLDRRITAVSGTRPRPPRGKKAIAVPPRTRAKGRQSLSDVLATVLRGKGSVKVAEAAKLALAAGYQTSSSQFGNIVSQTLTSDKRFRKVARGVYASVGRPGPAGKKIPAKTAKTAVTTVRKPSTTTGRKGLQPGSLTSVLVDAMSGKKSLKVGEAMQAVLAAGYKTKSRNFRLIVNQTLLKGRQFRKVGRGTYALKG